MSQLLCELIRSALTRRPLNDKVVGCVSDSNWRHSFEMAREQQVLAMSFPVVSALPKELRPDFTLWSEWMVYTQRQMAQSRHNQNVVRKVSKMLVDDGLSTMLIKGFSLAMLYPKPELREFGDVDIYSGRYYKAVNACMVRHGFAVGKPDGHHVHINIDGVSVEHHFAFGNSRVKGDMYGMEDTLQRLAGSNRQPTELPGVCFPNPVFSALYVGWHAYKHFLHERISLRHVIDWVLALERLTDGEVACVCKTLGDARWGKFVDALTAIALNRLMLSRDLIPEAMALRAEDISCDLEQRVWDDILNVGRAMKGRSKNLKRVNIARRMLQNGWKFDNFSEVSASKFLWQEFVGYCKGE